MSDRQRLVSVGFWLITACATGSVAVGAPILLFDQTTAQTGNPNYEGTAGWFFWVGIERPSPFLITALSYFDAGGDGLALPRNVGIWHAFTKELLRSVVIPAGTAAALEGGQWRTVPIEPLSIGRDANDMYAIGAEVYKFDPDPPVSCATVNLQDRIAIIPYAYSTAGTGFSVPTKYVIGPGYGSFGPSFSVAPIPDPAKVSPLLLSFVLKRTRRLRVGPLD
jgi:hypothetical protein